MDIIKQLRNGGLLKSKMGEAYINKDSEKAINKRNKKDSYDQEGTTTQGIDVGISPTSMTKREFPDKMHKESCKEEEYSDMIECAVRLNNAYKKMSGKDLHELYCPNCKPYDLSPATPDKGEKFTNDTYNAEMPQEESDKISEAITPEQRIQKLRDIVKNGQYDKVDGQMVDVFTASAIVQVYDKLGDNNKEKFANNKVGKMASIVWKLLKK